MRIVMGIIVVLFAAGSVAFQTYSLIRGKQIKAAIVQAAIMAAAVTGAFMVIYNVSVPSLAKLMTSIIPW
ncbi:hypothetical protein J2TS6_24520 [Paenibacillus albilobatus]|uniref:Uncharacterized protein n=2 Tax=Paenibacillus TaxID=44249 RepID=A0A919XEL8_9BACL|nr:hypothetical protein J2TS6_24520 [Paenibacillus albilobatus]